MFSAARMTRLAARKEALLAASAGQRERLLVECAHIQQRFVRMERGIAVAQRVLPIAALMLPLLRLRRSRATGQRSAPLATLLNVVAIARRFLSIWNEFNRK